MILRQTGEWIIRRFSSEAIGFTPLTTTVGDDTASDGVTEENEDASPSEALV